MKWAVGAIASCTLLFAGCGSNAETPAGAKVVKVSISDAGCEPATLELPAGPTSFEVTNKGSAKVTEFEVLDGKSILGEVENIADGFERSFALTLEPGKYTTYCPNGDTSEHGTLTVTGSAANSTSKQSAAAVQSYRDYVEQQSDELIDRTAKTST